MDARNSAIAQQPLQRSAVVGFDAHPRIHREAAVFVAQHVFDFAALQLRYEVVYAWHALAEYRWLDVKAGGTRQGWLVGLDRDIGKNFRIGAGYNFTEFSDDLTDFDYDHEGWFLNMVGMY